MSVNYIIQTVNINSVRGFCIKFDAL